MRGGSLCTGYGGLDLAVDEVLGTEIVAVADVDPNACKVIEARFPGVPNVGDVTTADWSSIDDVDVLTAGYPCQPFSHAGKRLGEADERHLWPHVRDALGVLRPRLVFLENVAGHLSMGFDTVLADLASLGFDAEWCVVRASDVGACHRRARLFVLAADADSFGDRGEGRDQAVGAVLLGPPGGTGRPSQGAPADPRGPGRPEVPCRPRGEEAGERGAGARQHHVVDGDGQAGRSDGAVVEPAAPDAAHLGRQRVGGARGRGTGPAHGGQDAPDAHGERRERPEPESLRHDGRGDSGASAHAEGDQGWVEHGDGGAAWGDYAPAIRRHELVLGRRAPHPLDDRGRLSPRFVEWMQMLDAGWVTDVPGLSRSAMLRLLGNGVVPPQAAYALRLLLARLGRRDRSVFDLLRRGHELHEIGAAV